MYIYFEEITKNERKMYMKIHSVAVLGAGAVSSYVYMGLSERRI